MENVSHVEIDFPLQLKKIEDGRIRRSTEKFSQRIKKY
jgi:hypothetical protein